MCAEMVVTMCPNFLRKVLVLPVVLASFLIIAPLTLSSVPVWTISYTVTIKEMGSSAQNGE